MFPIRLLARRAALRGCCLHRGRFLRALSKLGGLLYLGIVGFITGCGTLTCVPLCTILIMGWSFLFNSSVIVSVPKPQKRDRVTLAKKSVSLSLGGYLGDVKLSVGFECSHCTQHAVVELDLGFVCGGW